MNTKLLLLCVLFAACGGSLTDEQRKKAKASIALNKIKKISDSQITDASFSYGRTVAELIAKQKNGQFDSTRLDSVAQSFHVKIILLRANDVQLSEKEKLVTEAYAAITNRTDFTDNIQKLGTDSILYTKPFLKENPDQSVSFDYALGIRIPKKEIVLSIKN